MRELCRKRYGRAHNVKGERWNRYRENVETELGENVNTVYVTRIMMEEWKEKWESVRGFIRRVVYDKETEEREAQDIQ